MTTSFDTLFKIPANDDPSWYRENCIDDKDFEEFYYSALNAYRKLYAREKHPIVMTDEEFDVFKQKHYDANFNLLLRERHARAAEQQRKDKFNVVFNKQIEIMRHIVYEFFKHAHE